MITNRILFLVFSLLAFLLNPARADSNDDLFLIANYDGTSHYFYKSKFQKISNSQFSMWLLNDYQAIMIKNEKSYRSITTKMNFNCDTQEVSPVVNYYHSKKMGMGDIVHSEFPSKPRAIWITPPPSSISDYLLTNTCPLLKEPQS